MQKPRGNEGRDESEIVRQLPASAILTALLATAPALGWLTAQALYVAEPLLQGWVSPLTLDRWAQVLEGDEKAR